MKKEDTRGEVTNQMTQCILPSMLTSRFSVETRERICSSTACWCGASVELVHSLSASGVCLLGGLVHDFSLHPVASNVPDGQCAPEWPLRALVWPILPCTTSNSSAASVSALACPKRSRVATHPMRRVLLTAAPPPALCILRSTCCRLLEDLLPALSSAGPEPKLSQTVLRTESKQIETVGTNTVGSSHAHSTQSLIHSHTAQAHERSVLRVPRAQWMTDSGV